MKMIGCQKMEKNMGWNNLLILGLVAAFLCIAGFYRYVYFMSVGYGLAIAGIGTALILMFPTERSVVSILLCGLMILYGIRLAGFLIYREWKTAEYRKTLQEVTAGESKMSVGVKILIWIGVSVLYVVQCSPVFYRMYHAKGGINDAAAWAGILICAVAIVLESLADKQKSDQKKRNPDMVAMQGLYRMVRCPNYFGEILFWSGLFVSGFSVLQGAGEWCMAVIGYVCIVLIMFSGAKRLEKRQNEHYGKQKNYQEYVQKTPILIPGIPLYHLNKME